MRHRIVGLLAATLVGVAASLAVSTGPAAAAACAKGSGVTVVVGSDVRCDADGGGPSTANFTGTGHTLDSYRGFICRIDGKPGPSACNGYPPADAYWGLFWSDGTSGKWVYSAEGAGSLDVPKGGWVAFVFQSSSSKTYPSMKPLAAAPAPAKTAKPAPRPTRATSTTAAPSATPTPSATTASPKPETAKTDKTDATVAPPTSGPTASPATSDDPVDATSAETSGSGGLVWVAAAVAVLLLAGMGGMLWRRRAGGLDS